MNQERRRSHQEAFQGINSGNVEFRDLPEELRDDAEIALAAVRKRPRWNCRWVSERLKSNQAFVLAAVTVHGAFLVHASEELRDKPEIVLEAVRQGGGTAFQFASEALRGNREIVLAAIQRSGTALAFASEELVGDRDFFLEAIRQGGDLRHASEELRDDQEIVLEAVQRCGMFLGSASERLRGNREIVLAAIGQNSDTFQFASQELRGDPDVVLVAVRQDGTCLRFASEELRASQEIVVAALENANRPFAVDRILSSVPLDLQDSPAVAREILRKGGKLRRGSEIMVRLERLLIHIRALPEVFVENIVDEESVVEFGRIWVRSVWHKIWMARQLEPPGMQGTGRLFVELSGLPAELLQAKELLALAPVIGVALSFPDGQDWRYLNSYPARVVDESDDSV